MFDKVDHEASLQVIKDGGFYSNKGKWFSVYKDPGSDKVYRKRVETIIIRNGKEIFLKKKANNEYSFPGGTCEKDVDDMDQARNECREEAHIELGNIESTGISYKENYGHKEYFKDINDKFTGKSGYDGMYTFIYVGDYKSMYNGKIEREDEDPFIRSGKWYSIKECFKIFKQHHRDALMWYLKKLDEDKIMDEEMTESYVSNYFKNKRLLRRVSNAPEVGKETCDQVIAGLKKEYSKLLATSAIKREKKSKDLDRIFHPVFTFDFQDKTTITIALNFNDRSFTPGAATVTEKYGELVIIFPNFFDETPEAQRMILLHEIGHLRLGHLEWRNAHKSITGRDKYNEDRLKAMTKGKVIYPEYNADLYAVLNGANLYSIMAMYIDKDYDKDGDYRFTNQEIANRYDIVWKQYQKLRPYGESRISTYDAACMAVYEMVYDNPATRYFSDTEKNDLYTLLKEYCISRKLTDIGVGDIEDSSKIKEAFETAYNQEIELPDALSEEVADVFVKKTKFKKMFFEEADKLHQGLSVKFESGDDIGKMANYYEVLSDYINNEYSLL